MIINAENKILGRMAGYAAKQALLGERVIIINCERAVVSGNKRDILEKYKARRQRGIPAKGPFYPKRADRVVKRTIRGMLPYKQEKGKKALKRVRCYVGFPEQIKELIDSGKEKIIELKQFDVDKLPNTKYLTLKEITKELGAKYE